MRLVLQVAGDPPLPGNRAGVAGSVVTAARAERPGGRSSGFFQINIEGGRLRGG